jgi:hypothetical protein
MQARAHALELVGPLLHPVSRSETWRRLVILVRRMRLRFARIHFQARRSSPWRRAGKRTARLGGRAPIFARRTEKQEETDCKTTAQALYLITRKSQRKKHTHRRPNTLILLALIIHNGDRSAHWRYLEVSSFGLRKREDKSKAKGRSPPQKMDADFKIGAKYFGRFACCIKKENADHLGVGVFQIEDVMRVRCAWA